MSLRNKIQSAIANAFDTSLADAAKQITYIQINNMYDPITGESAVSEASYITRGVIDKEQVKEIFDQAYQPGDVTILILQNELPIIPKIDDKITDYAYTWKIMAIKNDPVDATWELLCRQ